MRTDDFDYHLPTELIAQSPIEPRDSSRLMILNRDSGAIEHRQFPDLLEYLESGDVMVFNQSRVIPARLYGHRRDTGSKAEFLLIRRNADGTWQAMAKPGRRLRPGVVVNIDDQKSLHLAKNPLQDSSGQDPLENHLHNYDNKDPNEEFSVEIIATHDDGLKTVRLSSENGIDQFGYMPLPPYIKKSLGNTERYQTVYSRQPGSVAAPTAGLHFTDELIQKARDMGVETVFVTLHVGLDTFKPIAEDDPTDHKIHTEHYSIDEQAAETLNRAKSEGRRIIAVGTTSVRVLEQAALDVEQSVKTELTATDAEASLFILPGHDYKLVAAMITNFHLPRSSLLMLVSAFVEHGMSANDPSREGRAVLINGYEEAIAQGYRFYSFGDATLIT